MTTKKLIIMIEKDADGKRSRVGQQYSAEAFAGMDPVTAGGGFLAIVANLTQQIDSAPPPVYTPDPKPTGTAKIAKAKK